MAIVTFCQSDYLYSRSQVRLNLQLFDLQYLRQYLIYMQTWHDGRLVCVVYMLIHARFDDFDLAFENVCKACPCLISGCVSLL